MLNKEKPRGVGGSTGSKSLRRADIRQLDGSKLFSASQGKCARSRVLKLPHLFVGGIWQVLTDMVISNPDSTLLLFGEIFRQVWDLC